MSDFNFKRDAIIPSVKRGAELLDEVLPGWHKVINQRLLNLATPRPKGTYGSYAQEGTGCILCQLDHYLDDEDHSLPRQPIRLKDFGDYNDGLRSLREYSAEYIDGGKYGFDIMVGFEDDNGEIWDNPYSASTYYTMLDDLWKEEIAIRTTNPS